MARHIQWMVAIAIFHVEIGSALNEKCDSLSSAPSDPLAKGFSIRYQLRIPIKLLGDLRQVV
jgi:hypothetical protein